jgi:glutamate-1-semialdehyde 2,1-aminomutase
VRFTNSGTEAVMTAIRIARAKTGRNLIVKFAGCYHGHADSMLVAAGSGVATLSLPDSLGIPQAVADDTIVLPYGDADALQELFAERGSEIAAVITEAVPANMGVVVPPSGFNAQIAWLTKTHGALFILDEVMTGFRVSSAGWWGIEGKSESWNADLFTFGKVIGGGMPLAAVAGSAECLDVLAPLGPVYQAGTLSGNPVATTAGLATLQLCTPDVYAKLDDTATQVAAIVTQALQVAGVPHQLQMAGNLFSIFFARQPVTNFAEAKAQDASAYATFFHTMLENGVWLPPSAFESWFVSAAHTAHDLEVIERAATQAAQAVAARN